MCLAVYKLLAALLALELILPEELIPKHARLTQYQFVQKRGLCHIIALCAIYTRQGHCFL